MLLFLHKKVTFCEELKVNGYTSAMPQVWQLPATQMVTWYNPKSGDVGSVLDTVTLGQVCSDYVGLP
jgi:hypothetical protein